MLKDAGKLSEAELAQGTIVSIEQYFNHMGDILNNMDSDDARFILLPQDETPFKINGNTRTVTVPSEFVSCGAVKGDTNCEIATFTIDRYFDYTDLANTQVYIQWQNAAGEEGISEVKLKDLSEPGVFRFGWPLTNEITRTAGTVKFAVRFFLKDLDNKYQYILNTQTTSLVVRDTLEINDDLDKESVGLSKFALFVKNSINPAVQTAAAISFSGVGGENLPVTAAVNSDNELVLKARGTTKAAGDVTYTWYFRPDDAVDAENDSENKYELSTGNWYQIKNDVFQPVSEDEQAAPLENEQYWVAGSTAGEYEVYVPTGLEEKIPTLYKRYSTLTITNTQQDIVGKYWCIVRNAATDASGKVDNYREDTSIVCSVYGPKDVEITTDLTEHKFVDDEINLAIGVKKYANEVLNYQWKKATVLNGTYNNIAGETASNLDITENGWYKVAISSSLNRKTSDIVESTACRVTHHPAIPTVTSKQRKIEGQDADWVNYEQEINVSFGGVVELKIETNPVAVDNLLSDELIYKWTVQPLDGSERDLTSADVGANGLIVGDEGDDSVLHSNIIKVRCVKDGMAYTYRCSITNELAGEKETIAKEDRPEFIIQ